MFKNFKLNNIYDVLIYLMWYCVYLVWSIVLFYFIFFSYMCIWVCYCLVSMVLGLLNTMLLDYQSIRLLRDRYACTLIVLSIIGHTQAFDSDKIQNLALKNPTWSVMKFLNGYVDSINNFYQLWTFDEDNTLYLYAVA